MKNLRNFSIIAHIDHGKSTLSDRLIQATHIVADRDFKDQILDNMDIERERGITIKSQTVASLPGPDRDAIRPESDRHPGPCGFLLRGLPGPGLLRGGLLLIDASQGVEAQTLANLYLAMEHNLEIIPVINKIDLPSADIERVKEQIEEDLGLDPETAILISAKEGIGIEEILEAMVTGCRPPRAIPKRRCKALIFDSHYDAFRGTVVHIRVFDGASKPATRIRSCPTMPSTRWRKWGFFRFVRKPQKELCAGQVGYIIAGIKTVSDTRCGDTVTLQERPCAKPMPGFKEAKPVVFSSIYPVAADDYEDLAVGH